MARNECIPFYEPGADISAICSAAVTGKRFVKISGDRSGGGSNLSVAHADAAGRKFGVSGYDGAIGEIINVKRSPGIVVPVLAGAAIDAFEEVEVGAAGVAVPLAAGVAVGFAVTAAANAADAQISLY